MTAKSEMEAKQLDLTAEALDAESVAGYLLSHPDFLLQRPELLEDMLLPSESDGNVMSMAEFQVKRLRAKMVRNNQKTNMILKTTAHNLQSAEIVQGLALEIVRADSAQKMAVILRDGLEGEMEFVSAKMILVDAPKGVEAMEVKDIDALFGAGKNVELRTIREDCDIGMHGGAEVKSDALLKLKDGKGKTMGMLAIGSDDSTYFHPGQGSELLTFLAGILSASLERL